MHYTISHLKNYAKRLNNLASSFYLILAKSLGQYDNIDTHFLQISGKNILIHYPFLNGKWYYLIKKLILIILLSFSVNIYADECIKIIKKYNISFTGKNNENCNHDKGLEIHYNYQNQKFGFLQKNLNNGYAISFAFHNKNTNIVTGKEAILFGAYSDFNASNLVLEIGIDSNQHLFVNRPDEKINLAISDDQSLSNAHTLVLSYNNITNVLTLAIDGSETMQKNIETIDGDIKKLIIGKNFTGNISNLYGFKKDLEQNQRLKEAERLSNIYQIKIKKMEYRQGMNRPALLCNSAQIKNGAICLDVSEAFASNPLPNGFLIRPDSNLEKPQSGSVTSLITCAAGYTASTNPAPSITIDSLNNITYQGSCILNSCNIHNIPNYFDDITSPITFGEHNFECNIDYAGSITLNCIIDDINMSEDNSCYNISNSSNIENYINHLIANKTIINSDIRNYIKNRSSLDDNEIDSAINNALSDNNYYSCPIVNIPNYFQSIITSPLIYGYHNFPCPTNYIGPDLIIECQGSGIDLSEGGNYCYNVTTENDIQSYITLLDSAAIAIDQAVIDAIKSSSQLPDEDIENSIETTLVGNVNYQCDIINIPTGLSNAITSPINYTINETINCDNGYNGSTILNCLDGSTIDMSSNADCTIIAISDFSNEVDAQIGEASGLDSIEPNLLLWLDGSNIDNSNNSTLTDGDNIATWHDLSGNNNDATQTDDTKKPIYNSINNEIYMNADEMTIPTFAYGLGSGEIFAIVKIPSDYGTKSGHFHNWGSTENNHYSWDTGNIYETFGRNTRYNWDPTANLTNYHIYNVSAANNNFIARINGMQEQYKSSGSVYWGNSNIIGKSTPVTSQIYIKEILFFSGNISDNNRYKINHYLAKKWNLESIVDSDWDGTVDNNDVNPMTPDITITYNTGDTLVFSNFNSNVTGWTKNDSSSANRVDNKLRVNHDNWVEKTFDFGVANANKSVRNKFTSITTSSDTEGWENSGSNADYFYIHYNGTQAFSTTYGGKGTTVNHNHTYNLNASGQITIRYRINTSGSDEHLYIENFELEANEAMYNY
jgi:hypothetical protein